VSLKDHCDSAHAGAPSYSCHFCLWEFGTLAAFSGHVMFEELVRSSTGVFKCPVCRVNFHLPTLLSKHFAAEHAELQVPRMTDANDMNHERIEG
jgi:hypothetical protein